MRESATTAASLINLSIVVFKNGLFQGHYRKRFPTLMRFSERFA